MCTGSRVDQLPGDADPIAGFAHRALQHVAHAKLTTDLLHIDGLSLVGEGLRAITNSQCIWLNAVMISSTMPSAKYSCSGSPDMLSNGRPRSTAYWAMVAPQRIELPVFRFAP